MLQGKGAGWTGEAFQKDFDVNTLTTALRALECSIAEGRIDMGKEVDALDLLLSACQQAASAQSMSSDKTSAVSAVILTCLGDLPEAFKLVLSRSFLFDGGQFQSPPCFAELATACKAFLDASMSRYYFNKTLDQRDAERVPAAWLIQQHIIYNPSAVMLIDACA